MSLVIKIVHCSRTVSVLPELSIMSLRNFRWTCPLMLMPDWSPVSPPFDGIFVSI